MKPLHFFLVVGILTGCVVSPSGKIISQNKATKSRSYPSLSSVVSRPTDKQINSAIDNALPFISNMLGEISCINNNLYEEYAVVRKYKTSDSYENRFVAPIHVMNHHRDGCLTVTNIDSWKMPANNALSFSARFQAPDSGEVATNSFLLYKQQNGSWLAYF